MAVSRDRERTALHAGERAHAPHARAAVGGDRLDPQIRARAALGHERCDGLAARGDLRDTGVRASLKRDRGTDPVQRRQGLDPACAVHERDQLLAIHREPPHLALAEPDHLAHDSGRAPRLWIARSSNPGVRRRRDQRRDADKRRHRITADLPP